MNSFLKDKITDYISSQHYMFLDSSMKEYSESILHFFIENADEAFSINNLKEILNKMAHLDLPLSVKKGIPHLLEEFFSYLYSVGTFPKANEIRESLSLVSTTYLNSFREDGSVKGETFVKKYSHTGRNDPCPCGSGKKFKKCCMNLIS